MNRPAKVRKSKESGCIDHSGTQPATHFCERVSHRVLWQLLCNHLTVRETGIRQKSPDHLSININELATTEEQNNRETNLIK